MIDTNEILKALGFSEEYINEIRQTKNMENYDIEDISFENDIENESITSSNMAIVEAYTL